MSVSARLEFRHETEQREAARSRLRLSSFLAGSGEAVTIHDLSATGFCIETSAALYCGETLEVDLPERGPTRADIVWSRDCFYGCAFYERAPGSAISAAKLRGLAFRTLAPEPGADFRPEPAPEAEEQDRLPLSTRLVVILGLSVALWGLIIVIVALA